MQRRWAKLDSRVEALNSDSRRRLSSENNRLLVLLNKSNAKLNDEQLDRVDELRDECRKLDGIRADMMAFLRKEEHRHNSAQAVPGSADLSDPDIPRRRIGSGIRILGQRRNDTPNPTAAGGHSRGRGRQSRRNARRHVTGRDRPFNCRLVEWLNNYALRNVSARLSASISIRVSSKN